MDFPGGTVDNNPPVNAGHTGSIHGPGIFYMPQSNEAWVPWLLSLRAATAEACEPGACPPQQKNPLQWEACAPQLEKAHAVQQRPSATKK